jgi:hypothetical protein
MPPRSSIFQLAEEDRAELDKRLIESGFGDYTELADWLKSKGYQVSKSAVHRYGKDLQEDFERTMADVQKTQRMAQAFSEANPDQRGAMVGATARIAADTLLRITMALRQGEEDPAQLARLMPGIAKSLGELGRLTISQEKWAQDLKDQAAQEARTAAASKAETVAKSSGVSADGIAALRAAILEAA